VKTEVALKSWLAATAATATATATARESGDPAIIKLANTIHKHSVNILNINDFNISAGKHEGVYGMIRRKIGQTYGYRDLNLLKSLILAIRLFQARRNMPILSLI
jgi:transposase